MIFSERHEFIVRTTHCRNFYQTQFSAMSETPLPLRVKKIAWALWVFLISARNLDVMAWQSPKLSQRRKLFEYVIR